MIEPIPSSSGIAAPSTEILPGTETVALSEAALMAAAQQQSGLSDWGDGDFREGFRILLRACRQEAGLSAVGQQWLRENCLRWLINRLQIQETLRQYPEILQTPIRRPLFVFGLPRSGTTLLHRLLTERPGARVPLFWELRQPAPPPEAATRTHDPRIALAAAYIRGIEALFPAIASMHFMQPDTPEECYLLFQNSFAAFDNTFFFHIPTYHEWICQYDLLPSHRYYKQQLQILSWRSPGEPWILKNPGHLLGVDAILSTFPDARIVHIHRHPRQVMGSLCSLQGNVLNLWREHPLTDKEVGEIVLNRWQLPLQRLMNVRATADSRRFFDVQYSDFVADPLSVMHQIHDYFDEPPAPETWQRMQQWVADNPQHKHGEHSYTLETFGLTPNQVDRKFADYIEYFKVKE